MGCSFWLALCLAGLHHLLTLPVELHAAAACTCLCLSAFVFAPACRPSSRQTTARLCSLLICPHSKHRGALPVQLSLLPC